MILKKIAKISYAQGDGVEIQIYGMVWSQTSGSQTSWSQKGGHKRPGHKCPGHKRPGHKRPGHKRPATVESI